MDAPQHRSTFDPDRPLPAFGVFALAADDIDLSVIARALDIRCVTVKRYIEIAVRELLRRNCLVLPEIKRPLHTLATYVERLTDRNGRTWFDCLTASEQLSVIEVRAYFRAFENAPHSVENYACLSPI